MKMKFWIFSFCMMGCAFSLPNDRAYVSFLGDSKSGPAGMVLEFDRFHDLDSIIVFDSNKKLALRYIDTVFAQVRGPIYIYAGKFIRDQKYEVRIYAKDWLYVSKVIAVQERSP